MNLKELKNDLNMRKELSSLKSDIKDYIELLADILNIDRVDFYRYNYEYDNYDLDFSTSSDSNIELDTQKNYIRLEANNITFAKIVTQKNIEVIFANMSKEGNVDITDAVRKLVENLTKKLTQEYQVYKQYTSDESNLNIYVVSNNHSALFAKQIQSDVSVLFNAHVVTTSSLESIVPQIESKSVKNIIIYSVHEYNDLVKDEELLKSLNDYIIVYGPNEHSISLLCGKLNIQHYLPYEKYTKEGLSELIIETKNMILNKFNSTNNIISISGISGGVGCTTIAMNMANILAKKVPNKNVLFIDLSHTKAISNLFLEKNPLPEKTIIDLVNSDEFDLDSNLDNGLVRVKDNFYAITGIQKHIDKEYLEKDIFIEKFLNYLEMVNEHFNTIIIDTGVFEASNLKTTIYNISNNMEVITEMNLPSISKLKTMYSLVKRAGLKEKLSFIVNRFDAKNSLSLNDVISILNITEDDKMIFKHKLSNDYASLGKYWNHCELVSNADENSPFVQEVTDYLLEKKILQSDEVKPEAKTVLSLLRDLL